MDGNFVSRSSFKLLTRKFCSFTFKLFKKLLIPSMFFLFILSQKPQNFNSENLLLSLLEFFDMLYSFFAQTHTSTQAHKHIQTHIPLSLSPFLFLTHFIRYDSLPVEDKFYLRTAILTFLQQKLCIENYSMS